MSDVNDLAARLFGTRRAEVAAGGTSTSYGTATSDSSGGSVEVRMGADTLRADGQAGASVLIPTTTDVRAGDKVIVTVADGHPVVTGVVGSGDRLRTDVDAAAGAARSAQESARSARASADAASEGAKTARAKAEEATKSAATAQSKAEGAGRAATQAQADAASAKSAATAAQTKADEAATAASTAQTKADTASTAAATAQSKAEDATASANAAGRAAASAQAAAEAAQGDMDSQQAYFWHDSEGSHVLGEEDGYRSDVRADGLHVLSAKDSSELARFTATGAQLGADGKARQVTDYHSWRLVDAGGREFAHISDLRDENGEYEVRVEHHLPHKMFSSTDPGETCECTLGHPLVRVVSVETPEGRPVRYGVGGLDWLYPGTGRMVDCVTLTKADTDAAGVTDHGGVAITYVTDDERLKAFSLGRRGDHAPVGASSLASGIESCASGIASVAMGCESMASGDFSVALGGGVTASGDCQTVVGSGNAPDAKKAFIVGNGDGPADHIGPASFSNAFAVGWDGSAEVQGVLTAAGAALGTPLPVASGGTGAATASAARSNLGAAASSHTHAASDIASGALPVSRGGTGATDAAGARAGLGAAASKHTHSAAGITSGTLSADRLPTVPVSKGGTGATDAASAFRALSGYTLDLGTNNTRDTWVPVLNGSTVQHRAIAPVYRLYNEYDKCYYFTASLPEYNSLVKAGWTGQGTQFHAFG